ncbi:MAG: hypothetical protein JWQ04_778 [Pedosphaera sp.]|nr:hypothetical protein [Pedosphaera sp.]
MPVKSFDPKNVSGANPVEEKDSLAMTGMSWGAVSEEAGTGLSLGSGGAGGDSGGDCGCGVDLRAMEGEGFSKSCSVLGSTGKIVATASSFVAGVCWRMTSTTRQVAITASDRAMTHKARFTVEAGFWVAIWDFNTTFGRKLRGDIRWPYSTAKSRRTARRLLRTGLSRRARLRLESFASRSGPVPCISPRECPR